MEIGSNLIALANRLDVPLEEFVNDDSIEAHRKLLNALADQFVAPPKQFIVLVGGEDVDLTGIEPVTLGDKKALKKLGLDFVKFARERNVEPEDESTLVLYLLKKRRSKTTTEEVDNISAVTSARIIQYFWSRAAEADDPFSRRSPTLAQPSAGASAK